MDGWMDDKWMETHWWINGQMKGRQINRLKEMQWWRFPRKTSSVANKLFFHKPLQSLPNPDFLSINTRPLPVVSCCLWRTKLSATTSDNERIYLWHAPIWWCVATVPTCLEHLPGTTFTISIWLEKSIKLSCLCSARCHSGQVCAGSLVLEHVVIKL